MSSNVKLRYLIPALVALAMIVYGVVTSSINTKDNVRDAARVSHSRDVLLNLQDMLRYMLDLETGQRGFIIVGEESYLEPYQIALKKVDDEIARLTDLTYDNPSQQLRIGMIKEVIEQRKSSLKLAIDARRDRGIDAAIAQVKGGGGKAQMLRLREIIDSMRTEELLILNKRQEKLTGSLRRTNRAVVIAGCVAITAGAIGAVLLMLVLSSREREERLRFEKEKAENADRAKSDFLAMMSHEIRTPMNAILGFSELLHDAVETPQQKHFAGAIISSGNSLLSLINDILDLSKIEAGKIELQPETVAMAKFAENLKTLFSFRAAEKGLQYSVQVTPSVPPWLTFDALRLRQVLVNLIGNAIKFSNEGTVTVLIGADAIMQDDTLMLHVEVTDTGIGISEGNLPDIFRPFYQIDSCQSRQFEGTGLGLSISRSLVESMNGKLSVQSILGIGSIFHVSVPTRLSRRAEDAFTGQQDAINSAVDFSLLKPSKILIADDEPLNRELIRNFLADSGHEVIEAENGEQTINLCLKHQPDVVLLDIHMPEMDGSEILATLRSRTETRHIPLIAVTASLLLNSQAELEALFDGFADKPISRSKLFLELSKFIAAAKAPAPPPSEMAVIGTIPLSERRDWTKLCAILDKLHRDVWPDIAKLVPAQGTLRFSARLMELAKEHECPFLANHARQLAYSAETLDFHESSRLLQYFPLIIAELRRSHD